MCINLFFNLSRILKIVRGFPGSINLPVYISHVKLYKLPSHFKVFKLLDTSQAPPYYG